MKTLLISGIRIFFSTVILCTATYYAHAQIPSGGANSLSGNDVQMPTSSLHLTVEQPDPAQLSFAVVVSNPTEERATIIVTDNERHVLHSQSFSTNSYGIRLNMNELPDGEYSIQVISGKQRLSKRIRINTVLQQSRVALLDQKNK